MKRGFSLIEFLVVIAVIGVLATIVIMFLSHTETSEPVFDSPEYWAQENQRVLEAKQQAYADMVSKVEYGVRLGKMEEFCGKNNVTAYWASNEFDPYSVWGNSLVELQCKDYSKVEL